jgi:hypothetical protein
MKRPVRFLVYIWSKIPRVVFVPIAISAWYVAILVCPVSVVMLILLVASPIIGLIIYGFIKMWRAFKIHEEKEADEIVNRLAGNRLASLRRK